MVLEILSAFLYCLSIAIKAGSLLHLQLGRFHFDPNITHQRCWVSDRREERCLRWALCWSWPLQFLPWLGDSTASPPRTMCVPLSLTVRESYFIFTCGVFNRSLILSTSVGTMIYIPENYTKRIIESLVNGNINLVNYHPIVEPCRSNILRYICTTWIRPCATLDNGLTS